MALHLYDPLDPAFGDSAVTRVERDRTFRMCSDCRDLMAENVDLAQRVARAYGIEEA